MVLNCHQISIQQQGGQLPIAAATRGTQAREEGGYLGEGGLRLWDNEILMGWYAATAGAVRSKGTM